MRSKWKFLFSSHGLVRLWWIVFATVGLFGQRADAMRTPLADVRAAITQPHQITATAAELQGR